jgi:uncharacterized protein (TIGR03118 family)
MKSRRGVLLRGRRREGRNRHWRPHFGERKSWRAASRVLVRPTLWTGRRRGRTRKLCVSVAVVAVACVALAPPAVGKKTLPKGTGQYAERDLVSDVPGAAELFDPDLVNPWGLALSPGSPAWVADNGTGVSTLYRGATTGSPPAVKVSLTVSIPGGVATGAVFNGSSTDFVVSAGGSSGAAAFLFASESGNISGWNPNVPPTTPPALPPSKTAVIGYSDPAAIFKGLGVGNTASGARLYATDFHNGRVVVLDSTFHDITAALGGFSDPDIPNGYAPFGIELIGGLIYVTYAQQDAAAEDDVAGNGHGFVDVYDLDGRLARRFASRGPLNSPWGVAQAPADFGAASGALLIGNFGDGRINAYDSATGDFLGSLRDEGGKKLTIDGLWALKFGNGVIGTPETLLFTAGPDGEAHGLFGALTALAAP